MMKSTLKGDIVKEYLKKWNHLPNLTIARMIYKDNPSVFISVETIRRIIRWYNGASGGTSRSRCGGNKPIHKSVMPYDKLPEGMKSFDDWTPIEIPGNKILVLADVHIPYHDREALLLALKNGKKEKVDTVLFLGDLMDCYSESTWEKDPRKRDMQIELDTYFDVMDVVRDNYKTEAIYYLIGNHEERHEKYLRIKAPELAHIEYLSFEHFFQAEKYKLQIIKDKRIARIGALNCVHGHELGRSIFSPVNPARGLYLKGKANAIAGHWHRTSNHVETDMTGRVTSCWSIGCLCDLHPRYQPINSWNLGFAIITKLEKNNFHVENKKIIHGEIFS